MNEPNLLSSQDLITSLSSSLKDNFISLARNRTQLFSDRKACKYFSLFHLSDYALGTGLLLLEWLKKKKSKSKRREYSCIKRNVDLFESIFCRGVYVRHYVRTYYFGAPLLDKDGSIVTYPNTFTANT